MSPKRRDESIMVPDAQFSSYYGHQIVKPAPWDYKIPTYLYTGGLAGGSGLLAAGATLTGRRTLERNTRFVALGALGVSLVALIGDLGKPSRFLNMMRTVKVTSPMSLGTWILTGYGAFCGLAGACEVAEMALPHTDFRYKKQVNAALPVIRRSSSLGTGAISPLLASYTAVLLSDTATPTWHELYRELPFVFVNSAMAASGGFQLVVTPSRDAAPARRMAVLGAAVELVAHSVMRRNGGLLAEPLHEGTPGRLNAGAQAATWGGLVITALAGHLRPAGVIGGVALNVGSALTRFSVFHAGVESAKDPKYTVIPQKERKAARQANLPENPTVQR